VPLTSPAKRYFNHCPPRASQLLATVPANNAGAAGAAPTPGVPGSCASFTVAAVTPLVLSLAGFYPQPADTTQPGGSQTSGVVGTRIAIYADGAELGLITGRLIGDVTGANAPVLATVVTTLSAGTGLFTAGGNPGMCFAIPSGSYYEFEIQAAYDQFLGFVGGGSGTMRIYQCSGAGDW
jgi:hypothetical protein